MRDGLLKLMQRRLQDQARVARSGKGGRQVGNFLSSTFGPLGTRTLALAAIVTMEAKGLVPWIWFVAIALCLCGGARGCEVDLKCEVDPSFPLKLDCNMDIITTNSSSALEVGITYVATEIENGPVLRIGLSAQPGTTEFSLYRLAPGNEYQVTANVADPSFPCSFITTAMTGLTGDEEMDSGPLVAWNRTAESTLDLMVYDRQAKYVAFDRTGWAVWYLDTGSVMTPQPSFSKFQHPDFTVSALLDSTIARYTLDNQLIS